MRFDPPKVTDYGSIAAHTFTNVGVVNGRGPQGKDKHGAPTLDKFDEPSNGVGLS